jgi:CubicO group peptidase (beta-lactamase class C family)
MAGANAREMRRRGRAHLRAWAIVFLGALASCRAKDTGGSRPTADAAASPVALTGPHRLAAAYPALDAYLRDFFVTKQVPSLTAGLVVDGELAWSKGYGVRDFDSNDLVDADTVYRVGSITKTVTAMAILRLRDEGKVSLDAPAATYLPELGKVTYPTSDAPPITVRHLLMHTSGLPLPAGVEHEHRTPTESDVLAAIVGCRLLHAPGVAVEYSSLAYDALGLIVQRLGGAPYRDYVTRQILRPLGMNASVWERTAVPAERLATAYRPGPNGYFRVPHETLGAEDAMGGLYSSVRDLAAYVAYQLDAWPPRSGDDAGPLRRSTRREMHTLAHVERVLPPRDGGRPWPVTVGMGLGWTVFRSGCGVGNMIDKGGGMEGYTALAWGYVEHRIGVVLLVNREPPESDLFDGVVNDVGKLLRAAGAFVTDAGAHDPECP